MQLKTKKRSQKSIFGCFLPTALEKSWEVELTLNLGVMSTGGKLPRKFGLFFWLSMSRIEGELTSEESTHSYSRLFAYISLFPSAIDT